MAGLVVAWIVVRSLVGFPDAGPTGGDYLGGSCLPSLARLVILARSYVDESVAGYVEIDQPLEAPTKAPVRWGSSPSVVQRGRRWMGRHKHADAVSWSEEPRSVGAPPNISSPALNVGGKKS